MATRKAKPLSLTEIAKRISVHLLRFEADKGKGGENWWHSDKPGGTRPYYRTNAYQAATYVRVQYIAYQGASSLRRADAEKYLAWLDAGNVGQHFEAFK